MAAASPKTSNGRSRGRIALAALIAVLVSWSAQAGEFRVQVGETFICRITSDGDLEFSEEKGEVIYDRHVFPGDLGSFYPDWSVPHLLVQRASDGVIVARIDGNNHNMYVRGKVYREQTDIGGSAGDADFLIKSDETTVARITEEGDLYLAGIIDPPLVIHHGTPNNGYLEYDVRLSSAPHSTGYYQTDTPNDWGGMAWMHEKIRLAGMAWDAAEWVPRIGVGRISVEGGGPTGIGTSHQNGLDVDVRYVRSDGQEAPFEFSGEGPWPEYDHDATQELVDFFVELGATLILWDDRADLSAPGVGQHYPEHHDHLHVRFENPDPN